MQADEQTIREVMILSLDDPEKGGGVGGKHTHIRLLANGLRMNNISPNIVTVWESARFRYFHRYPGAVARLFMRSTDEKYFHYTTQYVEELKRNLRRKLSQPNIVNPHDALSANAALDVFSERDRFPIVLTLHGYFAREATSSGELSEGSKWHVYFRDAERRAYNRAWRIVCVDSRIRDYVLSEFNIDPARIAVLPNAVDTAAFSPTSNEIKDACRKAISIREDSFVVLCPRRMVPKNGVKYAVMAMPWFLKERPNALLILAGDGPERKEIEQLIAQEKLQKHVILAGNVPHESIRTYYATADIVTIPSITSEGVEEATSLSMLEGMACGKPVIVTDIGGLKETISHGHTGILVPQADPEALASEFERFALNPALGQEIGASAREYVKANHAYALHAKRMIEEYSKAIKIGSPQT